jgi:serine/threonine protein kinase
VRIDPCPRRAETAGSGTPLASKCEQCECRSECRLAPAAELEWKNMHGGELGHFSLLEKIGEGGMGRVYKARDRQLERLVAIKVLHEARNGDAASRARFIQEAKAASALNHPNIITIYEIGEQDERTFIVMELVDGKPLNELIPRKGMRLTEALRVAAQVADALAAAHAAGIVHRDLKPANIMVDAHGRVRVLDFGQAKLTASAIGADEPTRTVTVNDPLTEEGAIVGSVPYMSPEQAEGHALDARSDIFSFGAVLYEIITGQRAFRAEFPDFHTRRHRAEGPAAAEHNLFRCSARTGAADPAMPA